MSHSEQTTHNTTAKDTWNTANGTTVLPYGLQMGDFKNAVSVAFKKLVTESQATGENFGPKADEAANMRLMVKCAFQAISDLSNGKVVFEEADSADESMNIHFNKQNKAAQAYVWEEI